MEIQKDQSESGEGDTIFLGTLEAQQGPPTIYIPNTSHIATIEGEDNRTKVMTEIRVSVSPSHTQTMPLTCKIDTGAEVNVISKQDLHRLVPSPYKIHLSPAKFKITAYGGHNIKNLGTCPLYVHEHGGIEEVVFNVTEVQGPAMLGCRPIEELGLVKFNCNLETLEQDKASFHQLQTPSRFQQEDDSKRNNPQEPPAGTPLDKESLLRDFSDCFEGLGSFNMKPYHITLDPDAEPVIHAPRTVPVHLQDMYKKELDSLVELGVLTPVTEPTDWVNSIVLSETTNDKGEVTKIRICLDPRDLNKAIKR